jgi:hypothetical protein
MSSSKALRVVLGVAFASAISMHANAVEDLSALQVAPQRGQSADQARRDRYECHNWAVEQTGETPIAVPARERDEPSRKERAKRAERVGRVLNGAAIGAGLGGLVRATQDENPSHGVLAGAAVGAAVAAAIGRDRERDEDAEAAAPSNYLRALTACMEGRGYAVVLPASPSTSGSDS